MNIDLTLNNDGIIKIRRNDKWVASLIVQEDMIKLESPRLYIFDNNYLDVAEVNRVLYLYETNLGIRW